MKAFATDMIDQTSKQTFEIVALYFETRSWFAGRGGTVGGLPRISGCLATRMSAKPLKWRFELAAPSGEESGRRSDSDKLKAPGDVQATLSVRF